MPKQGESYTKPDDKNLPMRIGAGAFSQPTENRLRFFRQLGIRDVQPNMYRKPYKGRSEIPLSTDAEWSYPELVNFRERINNAGLRLSAIECIPHSFYHKVIFGLEGRDRQIQHIKRTIRNLGKAGIPVLSYHWMPVGVWRTSPQEKRGGATVDSFDHSEISESNDSYMRGEEWAELIPDKEFTETEFWNNYKYFLKEILPVAEQAGVTLSLHPNDPPIENIGGYPALFRSFENLKRAMNIVPSDNHCITLCLGCLAEMGANIKQTINYFASRDEIAYVHFRNVDSTVPSFSETFIDEGILDPYNVMTMLYESEFNGVITPDHVPEIVGDQAPIRHRGRSYTIGYLQGILQSIKN
jgi:mannonate dehydratase